MAFRGMKGGRKNPGGDEEIPPPQWYYWGKGEGGTLLGSEGKDMGKKRKRGKRQMVIRGLISESGEDSDVGRPPRRLRGKRENAVFAKRRGVHEWVDSLQCPTEEGKGHVNAPTIRVADLK